jgi:hypothetical protein
MPLKTDFNVPPYFDDYDPEKQYYRVLFQPSVPVQARELTQAQTILQNQIERFGNWAFKSGDIVAGCSVTDIPVLPYVHLNDSESNGTSNTIPYDARDYVNNYIRSATTNLSAKILLANVGFSTNYPNTNIVYLKYINTGTGGETCFSNSELLRVYSVDTGGNTEIANVFVLANTGTTTPIGNAHGIGVSEGTIFINGVFVNVASPVIGIVNAYGTYAANNLVGFDLIEEIVTENQDSALLDNALGYPNENAPGAHRLKLTPTLVSYAENATTSNTFNAIVKYNYGALIEKSVSNDLYSTIGDAIAKRTFEQAGNYVVNPFTLDTITNTDATLTPSNANNVLGRIGPGVGYAQGYRVELQKTAYINMRRGVDTQTFEGEYLTFNYGSYFTLDEVAGSFQFDKVESVDLYDSYQQAVTKKVFSSLTPTGNKIGTASMRCFSYVSGTPGSNTALYNLHLFNVQMTANYNTTQVKSVYYNGTAKGVADVYSSGIQDSQAKKQLYAFGAGGLKNLRDSIGNRRTEYVYRTKASTTLVPYTTYSNTVVTISTGNTSLPFSGTPVNDITASRVTLVCTANTDTANLTGTITTYTGNSFVLGSGTNFTGQLNINDQIKFNGSTIKTVTQIINSTAMTVDSPSAVAAAANTFVKIYIAGKILPISSTLSGPKTYIYTTNSTSFTIKSDELPSATMNVDVFFDAVANSAIPASKVINKNRFVKINTASNPKGPWCLGISDVHKVTKIYGATSTYTTSGIDLTDQFNFGSGQNDANYNYAYIYAKSSYDYNTYPCLLVQLDYFTSNTNPGIGFFTVESYPIDDTNTANTNAIQTKDIPLYIDESGNKCPLRDFVDFRIPAINQANNTGAVDIANSAQVTTAISYATLNPSSTLLLANTAAAMSSALSLRLPSYGQYLQSDYTVYLGRKDLVLITSDNKIKVKEGVSSFDPKTPLFPDDSMPIGVINVPPYPSLSTDQIDEFRIINQRSKNLIRDNSSYITSSIVTNKRYTMKDIGKFDQRITNLEYYTSLSLLEKDAKDMTVTDANGLDRFKNGIFVDPMIDATQSDVSNPEYHFSVDPDRGHGRPKVVQEVFEIKFDAGASTNVAKTGRGVTIDYEEVPLIVQPNATKYRNAALTAYAWHGTMFLLPSYDNHNDDINTGSLNITIDNTKPWQEYANGPQGSIYGDWRTTTTVADNTVITGTAQNINLDFGDIGVYTQGPDSAAAAVYALAEAQGLDANLIRGNISLTYNGQLYRY